MFLAGKMHCSYIMFFKKPMCFVTCKKKAMCFVTINVLPTYVFTQCYHQIQTSLTCEQHF